jgi:ATP-binding cassette subfamily C protein
MRDFDTVRQAVGSPVVAALFDAPWAPLYLLVAFLLHFWIGMLALVSSIVLLLVAWRNQRATQEATQVATQAMAASHQAAQAVAVNSETVRALGMTGRMVRRQLDHRALGLGRSADASFVGGSYSAFSRFLRLFVQSAALGLGALLAIDGHISAGGIIAASILLGRALQPIEAVVGGWSTLGSARAALERLSTVLAEAPVDRIHTQLPAPTGHVQVDQVGIRGPDGRPMLLGVSLEVRPGEMLGIIGPSGSGKTTLAKIVAGAIEPEVGTVRVDGAQLSDWEPDELAQHMGFLPQEPSLFEGTIKENISRFAGEHSSDVDAQVIAAAKEAGVHELILKLPQGYDTRLGPMGSGLSAGQAQRVALARSLYGEPAVLILDEPNAFLDADGEAALLGAVERSLARRASVIMVAHRRTVLRGAHRLLVLDAGRPKLLGPAAEVTARLAGTARNDAAETAA